jgi:glucose/mannose-6-phosphate isomerase
MYLLDDLKLIHERDKSDALGVAAKQWQQLTHSYNVAFQPKAEIRNIVVAGMGGSGWPALYIKSWPSVKAPFEIIHDYHIPKYVDENTLFIASSYSGNTEETLAALSEAELRHAQIVVLSAGGQLKEIAEAKNYPLFVLPSGTQPRMSSFYFIAAYLQLLAPFGLVDKSSLEELKNLAQWLKGQIEMWEPTVPASKNPAKQLALELMGKTVIVYSGPLLSPVANKMKICFNENAKNLAWWNEYPEFSHNEFMGWTSHPTKKPFAVIEIRSDLENERIKKRFKITQRMLSGKRPAPEVIEPQGNSLPQQIFWASVFGDFVSIYLGLLNGVDPTPVDLVEKFKKALDE